MTSGSSVSASQKFLSAAIYWYKNIWGQVLKYLPRFLKFIFSPSIYCRIYYKSSNHGTENYQRVWHHQIRILGTYKSAPFSTLNVVKIRNTGTYNSRYFHNILSHPYAVIEANPYIILGIIQSLFLKSNNQGGRTKIPTGFFPGRCQVKIEKWKINYNKFTPQHTN